MNLLLGEGAEFEVTPLVTGRMQISEKQMSKCAQVREDLNPRSFAPAVSGPTNGPHIPMKLIYCAT